MMGLLLRSKSPTKVGVLGLSAAAVGGRLLRVKTIVGGLLLRLATTTIGLALIAGTNSFIHAGLVGGVACTVLAMTVAGCGCCCACDVA